MATEDQDRNFIFATLREFLKLSGLCGETSLHIENVGNKSWMNFSALLPSSHHKKEETLFNSATEFFSRWTLGSNSKLRFDHHGDQTWLHFSTTLSKPAGASGKKPTPRPTSTSTVMKTKSPRKRERQ